MNKKVIFFFPATLTSSGQSASKIRPRKMLKAMREKGYIVYLVHGSYRARLKRIGVIEKKLENGAEFEFLYSESLTIPYHLSEPSHWPRTFIKEILFFRKLNKFKIPLFCFYRDIYWRLKDMNLEASRIVSFIKKPFYYIELILLKNFDKVYLPSNQMKEHVPILRLENMEELPPACENFISSASDSATQPSSMKKEDSFISSTKKGIKVLYVGGLSDGYPMQLLFEAIRQSPEVELTVCTRKQDWLKSKGKYILSDNISITHESGSSLIPLYKTADVCSLVFEPQEWRDFAFPYKFFEYIENCKPILAVKGTPPAKLVEKYEIGIVVDYTLESLLKGIRKLQDKRFFESCRENIEKVKKCESWTSRVEKLQDTANQINR
ncbi:glycosyltransferase [Idiomarina abyssalis]|uniref:glycosyltransferase n=1 Tax=Idiomarina abyssalis TaxID=86102 RepID=UPI001CD8064A|nr:glycosyltransferase [Idiomarina abyssalis]